MKIGKVFESVFIYVVVIEELLKTIFIFSFPLLGPIAFFGLVLGYSGSNEISMFEYISLIVITSIVFISLCIIYKHLKNERR